MGWLLALWGEHLAALSPQFSKAGITMFANWSSQTSHRFQNPPCAQGQSSTGRNLGGAQKGHQLARNMSLLPPRAPLCCGLSVLAPLLAEGELP